MNCREAEHQIFEGRDAGLAQDQRVALDAHVAQCAACRRTRDRLGAVMESWQISTGGVAVPDADREWQEVRRRQRSNASQFQSRTGGRRHNVIPWLAVPFAAAAALAFTFFVAPESPRTPAPPTTAVELAASPAGDASTVVYLDEKSGWLVVWASAAGPKHI